MFVLMYKNQIDCEYCEPYVVAVSDSEQKLKDKIAEIIIPGKEHVKRVEEWTTRCRAMYRKWLDDNHAVFVDYWNRRPVALRSTVETLIEGQKEDILKRSPWEAYHVRDLSWCREYQYGGIALHEDMFSPLPEFPERPTMAPHLYFDEKDLSIQEVPVL